MSEDTQLTIETEMRKVTVITSADGKHRAEIFAGPNGTHTCCLIEVEDGRDRVMMSTGWVDRRQSLDEHVAEMAREIRSSVASERRRLEAEALAASGFTAEQLAPTAPSGEICGHITQADTPCQHRVKGYGKCAAGHPRSP